MKGRLGCFSASGLIAGLITLLVIGAVSLLRGGVLFSPGELSIQAAGQTLGGVSSHAELGERCAACHTAFWETASMDERCQRCHSGLFDDPSSMHSQLMQPGMACRSCHPEHRGPQAALTLVDADNFPHDTTGFSLVAHQQTDSGSPFTCMNCHTQSLSTLNPAVCAECHAVREAAYMATHQAAFGAGCLACHDGVDTYGAAFEHNQTAFPLHGQHAQVDCAGCHQNARSLTDLQAAPQDCYACHAVDDAHAGQFGQACEVCHISAGWEQATFDHNQTDFALTGLHIDLECESCHAGQRFAGTPTDCAACHAADDAHEGQFGQDCAGCHTADGWERATFDHNQTAFPLLGRHLEIECQICHVNGVFAGTPTDCFSCHAEDDPHAGTLGQDCAECHTAADWLQVTFDHQQTAFALIGAHLQTPCAECHQQGPDGVQFQGIPSACNACHAEPDYHRGLFNSECSECHTTDAWTPARYDQPHSFPLNHGARGPSECQVCHPTLLQSYTCYGCHEHSLSRIEAEHREEGISNFQDCVRCHPAGQEAEGEGGERGDD